MELFVSQRRGQSNNRDSDDESPLTCYNRGWEGRNVLSSHLPLHFIDDKTEVQENQKMTYPSLPEPVRCIWTQYFSRTCPKCCWSFPQILLGPFPKLFLVIQAHYMVSLFKRPLSRVSCSQRISLLLIFHVSPPKGESLVKDDGLFLRENYM